MLAVQSPHCTRQEFERLTATLAQRIEASRWRPDVIIGLAPWLTVAQDLAERLDVELVASMQLRRSEDKGPIEVLYLPHFLGHEPRNVLIAAHVADEGKFLAAAFGSLAMGRAYWVRTAVLISRLRTMDPRKRNSLYSYASQPAVDYVADYRHKLPRFYWERDGSPDPGA